MRPSHRTRYRYGMAHGKPNEFRAAGYEIHDRHEFNWSIVDLARAVKKDNRKGVDAVLIITAEREGYGKSMLAQIIATLIASLMGIKFQWRSHTVYYDWYAFVQLYDIQGNEWDIIIVDEAWEMLFNRLGMKAAQILVVQSLGTGRHKKHDLIICGPNMLWFDKVLKGHKAAYWVHITFIIEEDGGVPVAEVRIHKKCHTPPYPTPYMRWDCYGHPQLRQNLTPEFIQTYKDDKRMAAADFLHVRGKTLKQRMEKGRKPSHKLVIETRAKVGSDYGTAVQLQMLGFKITDKTVRSWWNQHKSSHVESSESVEHSESSE